MFLATWPSFLPVSSSRTERIGRRERVIRAGQPPVTGGQPTSDGRHRFPGAVLSSIFRQKRGAQHPLWTLCSVPSLWQQGFKRLFSQSLQNGMGKVYMLKRRTANRIFRKNSASGFRCSSNAHIPKSRNFRIGENGLCGMRNMVCSAKGRQEGCDAGFVFHPFASF